MSRDDDTKYNRATLSSTAKVDAEKEGVGARERERSRERGKEKNVRERSVEGGERRGERERAKEYERVREDRDRDREKDKGEDEEEKERGRGRERGRDSDWAGRDRSDMSISSYKTSKSGTRGRAQSPNWTKLAAESVNDVSYNGNRSRNRDGEMFRIKSSELSHYIASTPPLLRFPSENKDIIINSDTQKCFTGKNSGEISRNSTSVHEKFSKSRSTSRSISMSMSMSRDTVMTGTTGTGYGIRTSRKGGEREVGGRERGGERGGEEVEKERNNLALSLQKHPQGRKGANKIGRKGFSDFGYMDKIINENKKLEKKTFLEKDDEYSKHSESKVRVPSSRLSESNQQQQQQLQQQQLHQQQQQQQEQTEILKSRSTEGRSKGSYFKNFFARSFSPVSTRSNTRVRSVSPLNISMMTNMSSNKVRENVKKLADSHRACVMTSPAASNQRRHYEFD